MTKKHDSKQKDTDKNIAKIWCPDGKNFQYVKACDSGCEKKDKCEAFRDYFEPRLF